MIIMAHFKSTRCPTCDSPSPERHPAMQYGGEVQICSDAFHVAIGPSDPRGHPEDSALIAAVCAAHAGVPLKEHHALVLLGMLGVDGDVADEMLAAERQEAGTP